MPSTKLKAPEPPTEPRTTIAPSCALFEASPTAFSSSPSTPAPPSTNSRNESTKRIPLNSPTSQLPLWTSNFPWGVSQTFRIDVLNPQLLTPLPPTQRIAQYFSDIPPFDSNVVHVVAEISAVATQSINSSSVQVLPDEIPGWNETREEWWRLLGRLRDTLNLCATWDTGKHLDSPKSTTTKELSGSSSKRGVDQADCASSLATK